MINVRYLIIEDNDIKDITISKYLIYDENERIIYNDEIQYTNDIDSIYIANQYIRENKSIKVNDVLYKDSIILGLRDINYVINEIKFKIEEVNIEYKDDTSKIIEGNWNFKVILDDTMKTKNVKFYKLNESNNFIESCNGVLSPSGLKIELYLKEKLNSFEYIQNNLDKIDDIGIFYLKYDNKLYSPTSIEVKDVNNKVYQLKFNDIGLFSNIEQIELYLEPYNIDIKLNEK